VNNAQSVEAPVDEQSGSPTVLNTTEARQGKTIGAMRWVLGIGIGGTIIAFVIVWLLIRGT